MSVDSAMCSDCIDLATKHAEINRTYQAQEHVKKRREKNKRNKRHSTKAAQQAADIDGVIEATKKKCADNSADMTTQSTCEKVGQNYCAEEERKLMAIAVTTVVKRISAPIPGTPWNSRLF